VQQRKPSVRIEARLPHRARGAPQALLKSLRQRIANPRKLRQDPPKPLWTPGSLVDTQSH
jgi:hypothetical protein